MKARSRDCALFAGLFLASGCAESPRSCDLDTSALVMFATVSETDTALEIEIEFETATSDAEMLGTALALCPGSDVLTVNGFSLEERLTLGHLYYTHSVQPSEREPEYTILLERKDRTNIEATITMPPTFEFATPAAGSQHSRAEALDIGWGPAWPGNTIELDVEDEIGSTCIDGLGYYVDPVEDSGSYTLVANALSGPAGGVCDVRVVATRVLEAPYPEVLAPGGSLTAVVNRRLPFQSID